MSVANGTPIQAIRTTPKYIIPGHAFVPSPRPTPTQPRAMIQVKPTQSRIGYIVDETITDDPPRKRINQIWDPQSNTKVEDLETKKIEIPIDDFSKAVQELANTSGFYDIPDFKHLRGKFDSRYTQRILGHGMTTFETLMNQKGHKLTKTTNICSMRSDYMKSRFQQYIPRRYFRDIRKHHHVNERVVIILAASRFIKDLSNESDRATKASSLRPRGRGRSPKDAVPPKRERRDNYSDQRTMNTIFRYDDQEEAASEYHRGKPLLLTSYDRTIETHIEGKEVTKLRDGKPFPNSDSYHEKKSNIETEQEYRIDQTLLKMDKWATAWLDGHLYDRSIRAKSKTSRPVTGSSIVTDDEESDAVITDSDESSSGRFIDLSKKDTKLSCQDDWCTFENCLNLPDIVPKPNMEDGEIVDFPSQDTRYRQTDRRRPSDYSEFDFTTGSLITHSYKMNPWTCYR